MTGINYNYSCICYITIGMYYPAKENLPALVMEKMQFSLKTLVENRSSLKWEDKLSILNDVGFGLQYLHSRNPPIVHRDITPNNILLCNHLRAKISDLGVAKVMDTTDTKTLTQVPGTQDFMPPESLASKPVYDLSLDIFSFGGVILYICIQQWPELAPLIEFNQDTGMRTVLTEIQRRQQDLDKMIGVYVDLKSLVISCLDDNSKNRPLVGQVLQEIQQVKNRYIEKMYFTVQASGKQSTTPLQDKKEEPPQLQQQLEQDQQHKLQQQQEQDQQHKLKQQELQVS